MRIVVVEIRTALELFFLSTNYTNLHELRASYRWLYSSTDEHGFSRMGDVRALAGPTLQPLIHFLFDQLLDFLHTFLAHGFIARYQNRSSV